MAHTVPVMVTNRKSWKKLLVPLCSFCCIISLIFVIVAGLAIGLGIYFGIRWGVPPTNEGDDENNDNGSESGFSVSGNLLSDTRRAFLPEDGINITHVYATSPIPRESGSEFSSNFKLAPVDSNGNFKLVVEKMTPWVLMFLDTNKVGPDMVQGVFVTDTIKSVFALTKSKNKTTLSDIIIEKTARISRNSSSMPARISNETYNKFLVDLGMSVSIAEMVSDLDSSLLRNTNPDIDGDGVVDIVQDDFPGHNFELIRGYDLEYNGDLYSGEYYLNHTINGEDWPAANLTIRPIDMTIYLDFFSNIANQANLKKCFVDTPEFVTMSWSEKGDCVSTNASLDFTQLTNGDPLQINDGKCEFSWVKKSEWGPSMTRLNYRARFDRGYVMDEAEMWKYRPPGGTFVVDWYEKKNQTEPSHTLTFTNVDLNHNKSDIFAMFIRAHNNSEGNVDGVYYTWKKYDVAERRFVGNATSNELEATIGLGKVVIIASTVENELGNNIYWFFLPHEELYAVHGYLPIDSVHSDRNVNEKNEDSIQKALVTNPLPLETLGKIEYSYYLVSGIELVFAMETSELYPYTGPQHPALR